MNAENGAVSLRSSINGDDGTVYKVRVLASDGGTPPLTDTTVVTINVQRNLKAPVFQPNNYNAKILETQDLGVPFVTVKAKDEDQKPPYNQFRFAITGDEQGRNYFMINENNGAISVKQGLYLDSQKRTRYTVRLCIL